MPGLAVGFSFFGPIPEADLARAVELVLTDILSLRDRLNITGYSHSCLRDADSGATDALLRLRPTPN